VRPFEEQDMPNRTTRKFLIGTAVVATVIGVAAVGGVSSIGAKQLTGDQIQDASIRGADIAE
jgi:hypothetical protein